MVKKIEDLTLTDIIVCHDGRRVPIKK